MGITRTTGRTSTRCSACYRGAIGIKTGYTLDAGHCLLFEATRGGRSFIGVNLDSPGIGTTVNGRAATRMLNWAFSLRGY